MRDVETKRRVERMLSGDFRPDDLSRILLFLRDRTYGKDVVKETSNFISHGVERDIGLVTDTAREFFAGVRLHLSLIETKTFNVDEAPTFFPTAVKAALKHIDKGQIQQQVGQNRKMAERTLESMLAKFVQNANGSYALKGNLDETEVRLLRLLASTFTAKPAFTDKGLIDDLWFVLLKNGLVHESELDAFQKQRTPIILFSVAAMHGCSIVLDKNTKAALAADCGGNADFPIQVLGVSVCPTAKVPDLRIATAMFSTALLARDHCEADLLGDLKGWTYPIELSASFKLKRI